MVRPAGVEPALSEIGARCPIQLGDERTEPPAGVEPATPGIEIPCSILLSYGGQHDHLHLLRATPEEEKAQPDRSRSRRCSTRTWMISSSERRDSNPQPSRWQRDALPLRHSRNLLPCAGTGSRRRESNPRGSAWKADAWPLRYSCKPPPRRRWYRSPPSTTAEPAGLEPASPGRQPGVGASQPWLHNSPRSLPAPRTRPDSNRCLRLCRPPPEPSRPRVHPNSTHRQLRRWAGQESNLRRR